MNKFLFTVIFTLVAIFGSLFSQTQEADLQEKVPLILKALNYNKTLKDKVKEECTVAVLYNTNDATSVAEKDLLVKMLNKNKGISVHGKKLKVKEVAISAASNLDKNVIIHKLNAFWLTAGLESVLPKIKESAKYNQVVTISANSEMASAAKVALASQKTDKGYKVMVNVNEAKNINVAFSANLLTSAIVIK